MENNSENQRWYDKDPKMAQVLMLIQNLSAEEQEDLAVTIIRLINIIRESKKEEPDSQLSIGKNRVLGLYKSSNKRRWYDQNPSLTSAMNILATLPAEDCRNILEGILLSLSSQNIS